MEKKDMLAEVQEKTSSVVIKEFVADGEDRVQFHGEVKGKYRANHLKLQTLK